MTGADGSFSLQFQVLRTGPFWFYYAYDGTSGGSSPVVNLTVATFPVRLTAALSSKHVNEGAKVTVRGTAAYQDNGAWKPLAGNEVWLCSSGDPYPCASQWATYATGSATTNAQGQFSIKVPTTGSDVWTVETTPTFYFPDAKSSLPLTVALSNAITSFKASVNSFAVVTYSGCVTAPPSGLVIQYATKQAGPWYRLKTTPAEGGFCTQGKRNGYEFTGTAAAQVAYAYYRATYPASSQWQGASSRDVLLWKYLTRITSFSITPHHVGPGGHIHVSGRLWTSNGHGKWLPYARRHILVIFRYQGTWYRYKVEPLTNHAGRFSGNFEVYATSPFFTQYNGDKLHFACASARIKVKQSSAQQVAGSLPGTFGPLSNTTPSL